MTKSNDVKVTIHDLYQFLIAECRYGYTRNNHLMPWGAYHHVKEYLPLMLKKDTSSALITAKSLCEECISHELQAHFYDGFDDEYNNRQSTIEFINYLIDFVHNYESEWYPHNYNIYLSNIQKDEDKIYNVYEIEYKPAFEEKLDNIMSTDLGKPINREPLSRKEYRDFLFNAVGLQDNDTYNVFRLKESMLQPVKPEAIRYRFDRYKRSFVVYAELANKS